MDRPYYIVDAFTSEAFAGNAAAVVLESEGLDDAQMQSIAAEFNLSETTFVLAPETEEASARFRWFTPQAEVAMCGHATIAAIHALAEAGRLGDCGLPISPCGSPGGVARAPGEDQPSIRIDTLSGTLSAFVEGLPGGGTGRIIWLELPAPVLDDYPLPAADLSAVLGLPIDAFEQNRPAVRTQDADLLVFVRDVIALNESRPDFGKLKEFQEGRGLRGLCLATTNTLAETIHVQSRFFAPAVGIAEDPVTGSVHGPLAAYLFERGLVPIEDGTGAMVCTQSAGGRAGVVYALVTRAETGALSVRIGGQSVMTMRGMLSV